MKRRVTIGRRPQIDRPVRDGRPAITLARLGVRQGLTGLGRGLARPNYRLKLRNERRMLHSLRAHGSQGFQAEASGRTGKQGGRHSSRCSLHQALTEQLRVLSLSRRVKGPKAITPSMAIGRVLMLGVALRRQDMKDLGSGAKTSGLLALPPMHTHGEVNILQIEKPVHKLRAGVLSAELGDQHGQGRPSPSASWVLDGDQGIELPCGKEGMNTCAVDGVGSVHPGPLGGGKVRQS